MLSLVKRGSFTSNKHHGNGEDLLEVRVGGDITKADTSQRSHGEVESCDVRRLAAVGRKVGLVARRIDALTSANPIKYGEPSILHLISENETDYLKRHHVA